jgi:hypothetical protein
VPYGYSSPQVISFYGPGWPEAASKKHAWCGNPFALFRAASHCSRGASLDAGVSRTSPNNLNRPWFGQSIPPARRVFAGGDASSLWAVNYWSLEPTDQMAGPLLLTLSIVLLVNAPMELAVPSTALLRRSLSLRVRSSVSRHFVKSARRRPLRYLAPSRCGVQKQL